MGRHREALEACEHAIEYSPTDSSFWVTKGNCLRELRRFEEALRAHSQALSLWPSNWVAWYNRALVLEDLGQWERVVEAYERYLIVVPAGEPGVAAARRRLDVARKQRMSRPAG
jgi:tetratricopeptide (TPR) repeat protein